jgi:transcriptional regulator with XRE-family HTH domain
VSTKGDNAESRLAERLRQERESRGWTLADLAERSGVSRGAISKIERGESSPTAGLLVRLADAFDLTLAGLLARAEGGADRLSRAVDQPLWRDPASGYLRRQVFERPDHPVELVRVELPPGAKVGFPAASYRRIRQLVWLLEGELTIEEGGERRRLAVGDCLAFGPPADSAFVNESERPCVYLVALSRA